MGYGTGRAAVSARRPRAHAICDRCGFRYNHDELSWQFQWQGPRLQNIRMLVCRDCLDVPQKQLKTIIIPADPIPILNPRPENYVVADNPVSGQGVSANPGKWAATNIGVTDSIMGFGSFSNFYNYRSAVDGNNNKAFTQSAWIPVSAASSRNIIGNRWTADPSGLTTPLVLAVQLSTSYDIPGEQVPTINYIVTGFTLQAPMDTAFLVGSTSPMPYSLYGTQDSGASTLLYGGNTSGEVGENITVSNIGGGLYAEYRFFFTGDGIHSIGLAQYSFAVSNPETALILGSTNY